MRLIGYVDGVEVLFDFYPPNEFRAEIPNKKHGIYIIELHLIGKNGSVSNKTQALIGIDFRKLQFKFLPLKYKSLAGKLEAEYEEKYLNFDTITGIELGDNIYVENILPMKIYSEEEKVNKYTLKECLNTYSTTSKVKAEYNESTINNLRFKIQEYFNKYEYNIL